MGNHVIRSKVKPRKDRDYLLFDKRHFLHAMSNALSVWATEMSTVRVLMEETAHALEKGRLEELPRLRALARQLSWDSRGFDGTMGKPEAGLLMLLDALENHFVSESKCPDDFEKSKRGEAKSPCPKCQDYLGHCPACGRLQV